MNDEMILMGDALDDLRPFALDPEIAVLCDDAADWLSVAAQAASNMGLTLAQGIVAMLPRPSSGYMPKAQRSAVAHRLYSGGIRKPPRRMTAAERAKAEAARWTAPLVGAA